MVKFGHLDFYMGKSEKQKKKKFLENIAALDLKIGLSIQQNMLMKPYEYLRPNSFFDLGQRALRFPD